ncbi:MAG: sulfite exporter TauE/SafE family protein [Salaquimonas sp.]
MIDTLSTLIAIPSFQLVLLIVFATGIVRGFSGFGSGMIIGPSTAALFTPKIALAMIAILDVIPTLLIVWPARKDVNWKEVFPVIIGYAVMVPLGVWFLATSDPVYLRWFISLSILVAVAVLWSGWRYGGKRTSVLSFSVGGLGGFMGAAAALPGPAVLIYWLASSARASSVRANMIYYLFITDMFIIIGYLFADIFTYDAVLMGLLGIPGYFIGILIGMFAFKSASDRLYRNIAYAIILLSAVTSLPLLDALLRG